MDELIKRAGILIDALPYMQKFAGSKVVIKYGGNAMINEELKQQVMQDTVLLHLIGVKVVLVHGGGPEITETLKKIGFFKITGRDEQERFWTDILSRANLSEGEIKYLEKIFTKASGLSYK